MKAGKTNPTGVKKRTYTRRAVKKAIEIQDQEIAAVALDLQEEIRLKAYEIYLSRREKAGNPEQDWLEAEKIVLSKLK